MHASTEVKLVISIFIYNARPSPCEIHGASRIPAIDALMSAVSRFQASESLLALSSVSESHGNTAPAQTC